MPEKFFANRRRLAAFLAVAASNSAHAQSAADRDQAAIDFASRWLDLIESGRDDEAYALMTDLMKKEAGLFAYRNLFAVEKAKLGKLLSRRFRRIVWYNNPPNAPAPGVYAAVEFDSDYQKTQSHFQYVVLHSQNGEPFRVMRREMIYTLKPEG